uniref:Immunoglobulin domain-containing protein n=1 Tax=Amphiprion ocellaris TaxID=80972 RepID=A0A3Q1BNY6_AMPOC
HDLTLLFSISLILKCFFLLAALTIVEVKTLDIVGHVGKNVTVECSDWNVWTNVNFNVKYLCESPCSEDKHIIIKAEYGQTKNNNRIELTNRENGLFVTFTNLTMSDSRKYYCGVERYGHDSFIEVNLKVIDGKFIHFIFISTK